MNILLEAASYIRQGYNDFIFENETPAHWLVRYWMIHVNVIMCKCIYRNNPIPEMEKQMTITRYITRLLGLDSRNTTSFTREDLVKYINEHPEDKVLMYLGKTAMLKSYYTLDNPLETSTDYHYGIGSRGYTHWTSPIRRLPDLLNHILLLNIPIPDQKLNEYLQISNTIEKKQDIIEKFIITWNNSQKYKVGDIINSVVINVFKTGISVYIPSLQNKYTIHISKLSKTRLEFDALELCLKGVGYRCNMFDKLQLKISKLFFDILEFDILEFDF
jgi:ribonuclease R